MKRVLRRMLDPAEFLSPYSIRAVSRSHLLTGVDGPLQQLYSTAPQVVGRA